VYFGACLVHAANRGGKVPPGYRGLLCVAVEQFALALGYWLLTFDTARIWYRVSRLR